MQITTSIKISSPEYRTKHLSLADYQRNEWDDFIRQQIEPFGDVPVYRAIGNHEPVSPKTRADYLQHFAGCLDSQTILAQRLKRRPGES